MQPTHRTAVRRPVAIAKPTPAGIASALAFYRGARPPPDPGNETAPVATEAADTTEHSAANSTPMREVLR